MAGSSFGTLFRVTTFGESHCKGVGAIVDGCPPGMLLAESDIQPQLRRRRPGQSRLTTPREESDIVSILSGTERGVTLGTPIGLFVPNENVKPGDYSEMTAIPRPGHADYTYMIKYGVHANSGGGRASARETIGRVAAGAIAEKWLFEAYGTQIVTFVSSVGTVDLPATHLRSPDGTPWTRQQVDTLGTLTILRDAPRTGWMQTCPPDKVRQLVLDAADEDAFVAAVRAADSTGTGTGTVAANKSASGATVTPGSGYAAGTPAYEDTNGIIYDMNGVVLGLSVEAAAASSSSVSVSTGRGTGAVGGSASAPTVLDVTALRTDELISLRCPHAPTAARMATLIRLVKAEQDSTGGVLTTVVSNVAVGLGEPCFDKAEALLAHAMLSLPATKGFEIGSGFAGARLRGSQHNDPFESTDLCGSGGKYLRPTTNNAGGTLGGITSGADITFRVPIKPVSTIGQAQATVNFLGEAAVLEAKGRHDPCVLPRAPPLVEAMTALVLIDLALIQRSRGPVHALPPLAPLAASSSGDSASGGGGSGSGDSHDAVAGVKRKRGDME